MALPSFNSELSGSRRYFTAGAGGGGRRGLAGKGSQGNPDGSARGAGSAAAAVRQEVAPKRDVRCLPSIPTSLAPPPRSPASRRASVQETGPSYAVQQQARP